MLITIRSQVCQGIGDVASKMIQIYIVLQNNTCLGIVARHAHFFIEETIAIVGPQHHQCSNLERMLENQIFLDH